MAAALEGDWPDMFCEHVQHLLDELRDGNRSALSEFMHNETRRILGSVEVLRIPGKQGDLGGVAIT